MHFTTQQKLVALFGGFYIIAFGSYFVSVQNYEFLWYVATMVALFALLLLTIQRTQFSNVVLWGLAIWGLMHMAGGGIRVHGEVLYAFQVLPLISDGEFTLLKYDQVVHAFGFGVTALALFELFKRYWKGSVGLLAFAAAVGAMGLGTVNEIIEFTAVLMVSDTGVGGYVNTSLDLVANACGAILVALVLYVRSRVRHDDAGDVETPKAA